MSATASSAFINQGIPSKNLSIPSFTDLPMAVFSTAPVAVEAKDWNRPALSDNVATVSSNSQDQSTGKK
jgi:hypothetical protein